MRINFDSDSTNGTDNSSLSETEWAFINETEKSIKVIFTYYPIFLYLVGIPGNAITLIILQTSQQMRQNFVTIFLVYLSISNVMNMIFGLSRYFLIGLWDYDVRLSSIFIGRANIWCSEFVTHITLIIIFFVSAFFDFIITDGGKTAVLDSNLYRANGHYTQYTRGKAFLQACTFFYVPAGIIIIVNVTIILLYTRTRQKAQGTSKLFRHHLQVAHRFAVITLLCDIEIMIMEFPYVYFYTEKENWLSSSRVDKAKSDLFYCVSVMMLYTNYSINFIVYCFFGNHYRQQLRRLVRPCLIKVINDENICLSSDDDDSTEYSYVSSTKGHLTLQAAASLRNIFHDPSTNRKPFALTKSKKLSSAVDFNDAQRPPSIVFTDSTILTSYSRTKSLLNVQESQV